MDNQETRRENDVLLDVKNLIVHYEMDDEVVEAVNNVSFHVKRGEAFGLIGETGAGKTTIALSIMRLLPEPRGNIIGGSITFDGEDLTAATKKQMTKIRGRKISMIFQDPMTALNPVQRVGEQIEEVIALHNPEFSKHELMLAGMEMLREVGIPPERYRDYPFQFSGGMKQRVVIAIALACNPALLIADEPTTALDVTIQAQVLEMINDLKAKINTSVLLITHDLGIVAESCDKVAIMYAGEIVEYGSVERIFHNVSHPYTKGLFGSLPSLDKDVRRLTPIEGLMPDPSRLPKGCRFHPRCPNATEACASREPAYTEIEPGHFVRCLEFEKGGETSE